MISASLASHFEIFDRSFSEQGADLFASLLEKLTNQFPVGFGEEKRGFLELEVNEARADVGFGIEAACGDVPGSFKIKRVLDEDADAAKLFEPGSAMNRWAVSFSNKVRLEGRGSLITDSIHSVDIA